MNNYKAHWWYHIRGNYRRHGSWYQSSHPHQQCPISNCSISPLFLQIQSYPPPASFHHQYNMLHSIKGAMAHTVEPPIMDTPKSGQPPYNGQTVRPLPIIVHTFLPPIKGQHLNNGQNARPQCVHYSEVPLYSTFIL